MKDDDRKEQRPDGGARQGGLWKYKDGKLIERNGKPVNHGKPADAGKPAASPPTTKRKKVSDASAVSSKADPDRTED